MVAALALGQEPICEHSCNQLNHLGGVRSSLRIYTTKEAAASIPHPASQEWCTIVLMYKVSIPCTAKPSSELKADRTLQSPFPCRQTPEKLS